VTLCKIGIHKFGPWCAPFVVKVKTTAYLIGDIVVPVSPPVESTERRQLRTCERCGIEKQREAK
jgi:hypothetical protein